MSRIPLVLAAVLVLAAAAVASPPFQTVLVEPIAIGGEPVGPPATREDLVRDLQETARRSQAGILSFLGKAGLAGPLAVREATPLWLVDRIVVTATPEVVEALRRRPDVASVTEAHPIDLIAPVEEEDADAPSADELTYGLRKVHAPEAWADGARGAGVLVGHLDTGVYGDHPDLRGKVVLFKDFFGSTSGQPFDGQGHGTHTAGTIAGGGAESTKVGVAPDARLVVGRIFNNSGTTTDVIILKAMNWIADPDGDPATADAPRLVSNSWGEGKRTDQTGGPLWDACQRWVDLGILPVFAAGNSGPFGKVGIPAGFPHALAVGSTNSWNWISFFSSKGPVTWEGQTFTKPDVVAPGSGVLSCKDKGGYAKMSGTSMACPHAAGVAALAFGANPNLTVKQMVDVLEKTAQDLGGAGSDNTYGWGLLDARKAVQRARALGEFESRR